MSLKYRNILTLLMLFLNAMTYGQVNYQVSRIKFEGNTIIKKEKLEDQMNTRDMNLKERFLFWKDKPQYSSLVLENDLNRLKNYYHRNGFLKPEISKELLPDDKKERLSIIIRISEGESVELTEITFKEHITGNKTGILEATNNDITLSEGQRFQDKNIYSTVAYLKQIYHNEGYPFVEVRNEVMVDPSANKATVTYHIYPGEKAYFGKVIFEGDSLVPQSFLKKQLTFEQGDIYSQKALENSQKELFETGLFKYAIIRAQKDSLQNGSLPLLVRVNEMPQWSFEGGVGYGTEDRFRVSVEMMKRHFFGGARKLILKGKRSYYLPIGIDAKFIQPDLLDQNVDFVFNPFFSREREESYEVDRLGTGVTLQKRFSPFFSSYLTYSLQQDNLLDKTLTVIDTASSSEQLIHNKSGITLGLTNNSTDNIFEPTKGWRLKGYFTYMGLGFQSNNHYYQFGLDIRHYKEIRQGIIIAGRVKGGIIAPLKNSETTPIEDRYFIGGASSLRGWARNTISPKNEKDIAIGGNSMLETSLELRFPIYKILSGTAFVDAGNVWRESYRFDLLDLYYNTGAGLRVKTPIGPVRLDVAFPLFLGEFNTQFFISIGHAF